MSFSELPVIANPEYVETAISPEELHMPMVVVQENKENGTCSAGFELSLSGVRAQERFGSSKDTKGDKREPDWDRYTHSLLDGMSNDQELQIIYKAGTRPELWADDLQELPDFHVAARMLMYNKPQKPFVFKTLPMSTGLDTCDASRVVTVSRARYAVETRIVEEEIRKRLETGTGESENA